MAEGRATCSDRNCGKSMAQVIYKLNLYLKGWWNYYSLSEARYIFKSLNGWIIRRLLCFLWGEIPVSHLEL
ncbi:MAG: group II intron maturase-specific domain-containing protein [Thermodesulfobacteriota bacterium]|nr:group II intron maturase-specific domain-containing protein [Thermodesulfobacteriota bacterium]